MRSRYFVLCHKNRRLIALVVASWAWLVVTFTQVERPAVAELRALASGDLRQLAFIIPKTQPLPPSLAQWQDPTNTGDYFSDVQQTEVGSLVWPHFPVKIYVERPAIAAHRSEQWVSAVLDAVKEWGVYFPLEVGDRPEMADITIWHRRPPLKLSPTGDLSRARSAETRYELYISQEERSPAILSHRCTILLSPTQTRQYIQSAARHEIGHALGIWGHSSLETDTMYFSQVRDPQPISARDINTLKRVYEQPTRLGWPWPKVTK